MRVGEHWRLAALVLAVWSTGTDALAKLHHARLAFACGVVGAACWAYLLGTRAPLGRCVPLYCVLSYGLTVAAARLGFHEPLRPSHWYGLGLGLAAVALLAWEG